MKERAADMKSEMQATFQTVSTLRARAEKQKDVIKLSCVNDKMVQLKAQMNIADKQHEALTSALDKSDDERSAAFRDVSSSADSIRRLKEDATACMGESELYKQESGVEVSHPEIIDDPTIIDPYEFDPTLEVEPPGYASAYR